MSIGNIICTIILIWIKCALATFIAIRIINPKRTIGKDILLSLALGPIGLILLAMILIEKSR